MQYISFPVLLTNPVGSRATKPPFVTEKMPWGICAAATDSVIGLRSPNQGHAIVPVHSGHQEQVFHRRQMI